MTFISKIKTLLLLLFIFFLPILVFPAKTFAATIYVDGSNTGTEDGSSGNPYNTIQEGVDAAANGDTVQVAAGTYTENVDLTSASTMTSETTLVSASGAATTIIDADSNGSGIIMDSNWTVDGFTIQNGTGTANVDLGGAVVGGGIYIDAKTNITIQNSTITNNSAANAGGGLVTIDTTNSTIFNCTFSSNSSSTGGGALFDSIAGNQSWTVTDCTFNDNTATDDTGSAIRFFDQGGGTNNSITLSGCIFSNNTSDDSCVVLSDGSTTTVTNCLFYSNDATGTPRGALIISTTNLDVTATVTNCTFANNSLNGITLGTSAASTVTVRNSIFSGNSLNGIREGNANTDATPINCLFNNNTLGDFLDEGSTFLTLAQINALTDPSPASGNISGDPLFVSTTDYHLQAQNFGYATDSPCIDAGTATGAPATDIEDNTRPQGDEVDIGAYENSSSNTSSKDANKKRATAGDIITYTVTITNNSGQDIANAELRDGLPKGFKYIEGTTTLDNTPQSDPTGTTTRTFTLGTLSANTTYTLRYKLVVGSGVSFGNYTNTAILYSTSDSQLSSQVSETVTIVANPLFYNATLIGKVFNDKNNNQIQDNNEEGIPDVELAIEIGLRVKTDQYGRYHINDLKPMTHIIGLDTNTLPKNSKLTTENPVLLTPVTEGVTLKANFGVLLLEEDRK